MFKTEMRGSWVVVHPSGELDLAMADEFRDTMDEVLRLDRSDAVAIDFSDVSFLDSSGIGVIIASLRKIRERGGQLILVRLPQQIRSVLRITGVDTVIDIRPALVLEEEYAVEWIIDEPNLTSGV